MVKRLFQSKLFVLFLSLILVGFLIGYTFSVLNAKDKLNKQGNTPEDVLVEVDTNQK